MEKNRELDGFFELTSPLPFYVDPEDFAWRIRDVWLGDIEKGSSPMRETVMPYLEREAVSRFKREWPGGHSKRDPDIREGYEHWRLWWLNKALQYAYSPIGVADSSLSEVGKAAVNILITASELRQAIAQNKSERACALGMLLLSEALLGGYVLQHKSTQETAMTLRRARQAAFQSGIGKSSNDLELARIYTKDQATQIWEKDATLKIGEVAQSVISGLKLNRKAFSEHFAVPDEPTIKRWIRDAKKRGELVIPAGAQSPGRPRKAK